MTEIALTPQQQAVTDVIRSGGTIHGAIAIANVLRKDVLAWRREIPHFAAALEQAFSERDLMHRERVMALVDQAYQTSCRLALGTQCRDAPKLVRSARTYS